MARPYAGARRKGRRRGKPVRREQALMIQGKRNRLADVAEE